MDSSSQIVLFIIEIYFTWKQIENWHEKSGENTRLYVTSNPTSRFKIWDRFSIDLYFWCLLAVDVRESVRMTTLFTARAEKFLLLMVTSRNCSKVEISINCNFCTEFFFAFFGIYGLHAADRWHRHHNDILNTLWAEII